VIHILALVKTGISKQQKLSLVAKRMGQHSRWIPAKAAQEKVNRAGYLFVFVSET
jgi:hypothetical protein